MLLELRAENYAVIDHAIAVFGPVLRLSVYSTRRFSFTCSGIKKTFSEHAKGHGIPLFSLAFRYVPGKFYAEAGAASRKLVRSFSFTSGRPGATLSSLPARIHFSRRSTMPNR